MTRITPTVGDAKLVFIIGRDEHLKKEFARELNQRYTIIRNPENNQHPHMQCKFAEEVAISVNGGVGEFPVSARDLANDGSNRTFAVVTNSPYIIDHIANLMAGHKYYRGGLESKLITGDARAFIDQKIVAAFECSGGRIRNILEDDGMINWKTFSEVSEWVAELYFQLTPDL